MTARTHGVWESAMDLQRGRGLEPGTGTVLRQSGLLRLGWVYRLPARSQGRVLGRVHRSYRPRGGLAQADRRPPDAGSHPAAFLVERCPLWGATCYALACFSIMSGLVSFDTR